MNNFGRSRNSIPVTDGFAFAPFAHARLNARVAGNSPAQVGAVVMNTGITPAEQLRRERQRAMSIAEFCQKYSVGRTTAYLELKSRRLRGRKIGRRTIITEDDAETWLGQLPVIEAARKKWPL